MINIYNGDCLELIENVDSKSIDLIITSPPYNMTMRKGGISDKGRYDEYKDWKPEKEYLEWICNLFKKTDRVLNENGVFILNFSYSIENPSLPYKLVAEIIFKTKFELVDTIVWKKRNSIPFPAQPRRLQRVWEFIFIFCRKKEIKTYNINKKIKSISLKTKQKYFEIIPNYIEAANNDGNCKLNQAAFSSELIVKLINIFSIKENDTILDPFMGTGTTAIACMKTNRNFVGFEISKKQCEYAKERIKNF